jgi:hypothetical protein
MPWNTVGAVDSASAEFPCARCLTDLLLAVLELTFDSEEGFVSSSIAPKFLVGGSDVVLKKIEIYLLCIFGLVEILGRFLAKFCVDDFPVPDVGEDQIFSAGLTDAVPGVGVGGDPPPLKILPPVAVQGPEV